MDYYRITIQLRQKFMPNCLICKKHFPNVIKIDGVEKNLQRRKYCLECSPFGGHNTKKLHLPNPTPNDMKNCPRCNIIQSRDNFYQKRGVEGNSTYCKKCTTDQTTERQQKFKLQCIEYKGGCCEICGYNKCAAALEFHHKDPNEKEFLLSQRNLRTFNEEITNELDKCSLLCANCHREIHWLNFGETG